MVLCTTGARETASPLFFIACLLPRLPLFLHVAWLEAARPWETPSFFKSPQSLLRNPNVKSITSLISLEVVVHQGRFVSASRQLMNFQTSLTSKRSRARAVLGNHHSYWIKIEKNRRTCYENFGEIPDPHPQSFSGSIFMCVGVPATSDNSHMEKPPKL